MGKGTRPLSTLTNKYRYGQLYHSQHSSCPRRLIADKDINALWDTLHCDPSNSCQIGNDKSWSVTVGADFSASVPDQEWISGGFSVEYSEETTDSHQCDANGGDNTCVWYSAAYTQVGYYILSSVRRCAQLILTRSSTPSSTIGRTGAFSQRISEPP